MSPQTDRQCRTQAAAARIAGFVTVLLGTVVLVRFAGEGIAAQQSAAVADAIAKPVVRVAGRGAR